MKKSHSIYKKILLITLYISLIIYLISFFSLNFRNDEEFTMAMIHHSFLNIIRIDSYDVHPPLYYLVLKLFLNISTFWTNSIFIKIIFARLFSFISFYLSFYLLTSIFKVNKYKLKKRFLFIIILFFPSILFFATQIRMYAFGALLLILGIYLYQKLSKSYSLEKLTLFFLCMLSASYVHYYYALFAGIFILIIFITYISKKMLRKSLVFLGLDILLCICYLPWFFYTLGNVLGMKKVPNITLKKIATQIFKIILAPTGILYSSLNGINIPSKILLIALIYILIFYSIYKIIIKMNMNKLFIINLIITLTLLIIGASTDIFGGFEFSDSFLYPSFLIMVFMISLALVRMNNKLLNIIFIFVALLVILMNLSCNITNYHSSLIQVNKYEHYKHLGKNVYVNTSKKSSELNKLTQQMLLTHDPFIDKDQATILMYMNKNIIPKNKFDDSKLGHALWNNVINTKH